MFSKYRGRGHTKKQRSYKSKISKVERTARDQAKKFEQLFPSLAIQLTRKHKSIYQHAVSVNRKSIAV